MCITHFHCISKHLLQQRRTDYKKVASQSISTIRISLNDNNKKFCVFSHASVLLCTSVCQCVSLHTKAIVDKTINWLYTIMPVIFSHLHLIIIFISLGTVFAFTRCLPHYQLRISDINRTIGT